MAGNLLLLSNIHASLFSWMMPLQNLYGSLFFSTCCAFITFFSMCLQLWDFLVFEITHNSKGRSQRNYDLNFLEKTRLFGHKTIETPILQNYLLMKIQRCWLLDYTQYFHIVAKLIYLAITILDIFFIV